MKIEKLPRKDDFLIITDSFRGLIAPLCPYMILHYSKISPMVLQPFILFSGVFQSKKRGNLPIQRGTVKKKFGKEEIFWLEGVRQNFGINISLTWLFWTKFPVLKAERSMQRALKRTQRVVNDCFDLRCGKSASSKFYTWGLSDEAPQ